jgi:hypothetical protein
MAQADLNVANQSGSAFRADLNNQLLALGTLMSGASEPSTTYSYMLWADTTAGLLKQRNAANNAWVTVGTLGAANLGLAALASPTFTGTVTIPTLSVTGTATAPLASAGAPSYSFTGDPNTGLFSPGADQLALSTNGANRLHIDSTGRVGLGTTAPAQALEVSAVNARIRVTDSDTTAATSTSYLEFFGSDARAAVVFTDSAGITVQADAAGGNAVRFNTSGGNERARIDSSGRLLLGTSTSSSTGNAQYAYLQIKGGAGLTGSFIALLRAQSSSMSSGSHIGGLTFGDESGNEYARFACESDAAGGSGDYPGRLVFSTTADGASSPTERMRINNDGSIVGGGNTSSGNLSANTGFALYRNSSGNFNGLSLSKNATDWGTAVYIHRTFSAGDGALIEFAHDTVTEGVISVSGTTVTYGGGHLARWSQLPNDEDPSGLLKGTVMSNLDEMCEWGEEDNEQLNKTKISDVEGDPNVAGVFVSTSFSDDGPLDYFCAMTGDMIIRIAEGVTVQRGDLLMSAGDGTAKPQDDDIIRSKTVAKVTSTHVTCTYDDGSYCVPCVLMAC